MVDMSCSMYSYGMLEVHRLAGRQTFVDAGFDDEGNLTRDPSIVEKTVVCSLWDFGKVLVYLSCWI